MNQIDIVSHRLSGFSDRLIAAVRLRVESGLQHPHLWTHRYTLLRRRRWFWTCCDERPYKVRVEASYQHPDMVALGFQPRPQSARIYDVCGHCGRVW